MIGTECYKSASEVMKPNKQFKCFPKGKKKTYSSVENCWKLHAGMFSGCFSLLYLSSSMFWNDVLLQNNTTNQKKMNLLMTIWY